MIVSGGELAIQLRNIIPKSIAVAYVSKSWAEYIDINVLSKLVVSPQLGSDPSAIVDIAENIGWDNVHILEKIHSKIYIGDDSVMLGSANLSYSAFGETDQEEACVVLKDQESLETSRNLFERYINTAQKQYPNKKSKLERIDKLREENRKALAHGIYELEEKDMNRVKPFNEYSCERDGLVFFVPYLGGETVYDPSLPEVIMDDIYSIVHLSPKDIKPTSQWILHWKITGKGFVHGKFIIEWVYIHEVFDNGTQDPGYEAVGIQRESLNIPENKPFDETDPQFLAIFKKVMDKGYYDDLRNGVEDELGNCVWTISGNEKLMAEFVSEIHEEYVEVD
jgi:predicted nucleic-acid-binding protein